MTSDPIQMAAHCFGVMSTPATILHRSNHILELHQLQMVSLIEQTTAQGKCQHQALFQMEYVLAWGNDKFGHYLRQVK